MPLSAAVLVGAASFAVAALTLFSGFGLGTLLMPVFALFFPVPVAVASTALVHVTNNAFKVLLLRRDARRDVLLRFGAPALGMAFVGAWLLGTLASQPALLSWQLGEREVEVTPVAGVMGLVVLAFALAELSPALARLRPSPRWLPLGGALSGFFGGLSGHQGALRAAFLSPLGLSAPEFAATQAVLGFLVDLVRIPVYAAVLAPGSGPGAETPWPLVGLAAASALAGSLLGRRWLPGMTLRSVRWITGGLLLVVGLALATGLA
jgi:uncharacterized membrane protein YfcA